MSEVKAVTGADVILRVLEEEGVEVCFGIPGGAILPLYDSFARGTTIRHVLARHEQGAGHMAEGYARASGKVGVAIATSGPGATNLVTPIANAAMDSTPLLCVTGQVSRESIGTDAFQECDIVGVTRPLVKRSWLVDDAADLAGVMREALHCARSRRPGPVLVDVPRDVQEAEVGTAAGAGRFAPAEPPPLAPEDAVLAVARAIEGASRPILYAGGGAVNAGAGAALTALAEEARLPVVSTLMAKGAISERHELSFGCPGMHGGKWANWALNMADLVIAVGARFDDRVTGRLEEFAPVAKVAHLDLDPRELGKVRHPDYPVLGQLPDSLRRLRAALRAPAPSEAWIAQLRDWRKRFPLRYGEGHGELKPQRVLERLDELLRDRSDVIWTTGVGQHQMWAMQYLTCPRPRSFITSGGHGTMGFGLPAAIGARVARPQATVVCVDGDGSFQMTAQELATAVEEDLPIVVVVINNGGLGMVRQWQTMFYDGRVSGVDLAGSTDCNIVARGFGAAAFTVRTEPELERALAEALAARRPSVLDVHVAPDEVLLPMIKPGCAAVDVLEYGSDE
jgi:acetolactate synthase I/II/III large subunit